MSFSSNPPPAMTAFSGKCHRAAAVRTWHSGMKQFLKNSTNQCDKLSHARNHNISVKTIAALLSLLCLGSTIAPTIPPREKVFTVTAVGWDGTETVPSNALTLTNSAVQLAWDHDNLANVMHFNLHVSFGAFSRVYDVGRELTVHWPITRTVVIVLTVAASLTLTNPIEPAMFFALCYRTNLLDGEWVPIRSATITRTNL